MHRILPPLFQLILFPALLSAQWQLQYPAVDPSSITDITFVSERVGFCSTMDAAIYKTTDLGVTWKEVVRKEREAIHSIVFSDSLNGVAILPNSYIGDQLNILQTSDGGETWNERFIPPFNGFAFSMLTSRLYSVRPGLWLMASYAGKISISTDLVNWATAFGFGMFIDGDVGMPVAVPTSFAKLENGRMLALADKYYYQRSRGISDSVSIVLASDTSCVHWDTLWVGADVPLYSLWFTDTAKGWAVGDQGTIMRTTNGGAGWERVYRDSTISLKYVTASDSLHLYAVADQTWLLLSTDGGQSWNKVPVNSSRYFPKVVFFDKENGLLAGYSGLPLRTTDGGMSWSDQASGIAGSISRIKFITPSRGFALASGRTYQSSDGGRTWQGFGMATTSTVTSFEMFDSLNGWATDDTAAYETTDGGNTWSVGFSDRSLSIYRGIRFFDGRLGVIAEARTIDNNAWNYITLDGGKTWTGYEMPSSVSSYSKIQFTDYQHAWLIEQGGVWKSVDTGKTWKKIYWDSTYALPWGFDFVDSLHGWYVTDKARFTTDGGATWNTAPIPYYDQNEDVHFISLKKGYAVGYDGGIFSTSDGGWTWKSDTRGSSAPLFSISDVSAGNVSHLWVGGDSFVVESMTTATSQVPTNQLAPAEFALAQNYPNPFNPATTIGYQLKSNSLVTLRVYDILGRLVRRVLEERQSAGAHLVRFDGSTLSSGVYFYRLQAGNFSDTKKLILLR